MDESLNGKRILLGVSGSIAAYKAADLASRLVHLGADVHVILTVHAAEFVGPATFRALTLNPVLSGLFDEPYERKIAHIDLAQSADLILVAPATANTIAKMALGLADDLLSSALLAAKAPIIAAPAMNTAMLDHPATRANLAMLKSRGVHIVEPKFGILACGTEGEGKLADVSAIVEAVCAALEESNTDDRRWTMDDELPFSDVEQPELAASSLDVSVDDESSIVQSPSSIVHSPSSTSNRPLSIVHRPSSKDDFEGIRVLVTAGATREPLDPVRFISNRSSGRMGFAIAEAAAQRGARVTLVSGHVTVPFLRGVETICVNTTADMLAACESRFPESDVFIGAAAPADYAVESLARNKHKKTGEGWTLRLRETPDIISTLAQGKTGQIMVGFAAETINAEANAADKLKRKNLDLIAANDVTAEGAGFEVETNVVTLIWPDGRMKKIPKLPKPAVADRILDAVADLLPFR